MWFFPVKHSMKQRRFSRRVLPALCVGLAAFTLHCGGGSSGGGSNGSGTVTPTPPTASITLSSLAPIVTMQNGSAFSLTANGSGFSSGDQVVFNGSMVAATVSNSTQLTAQIPGSAISKPGTFSVTVQSGGTTSSAQDFYVVPAINPTPVTVTGGATASVSISVATVSSLSPLLLQAIGINTSAGSSAIAVSPGQTVSLFVVGTGILPGTFYEVTGNDDVAVTQPVVSDFTKTTGGTPAVNLSVTISSSAAAGPRNLIVTDPAGEISVFPGGILIGSGS
jgi:hypothetical protein